MVEEIKAENGAIMSADRKYRYRLHRFTDSGHEAIAQRRYVNFIMLNPSSADETVDDPTVRLAKVFAKKWGYSWVVITNLFALRATDPKDLLKAEHPVSPPEYPKSNDQYILQAATGADKVVAAWGEPGAWQERDLAVLEMLYDNGIVPWAIGFNKNGTPKHLLYQPLTNKLLPYDEAD